jgi:hypothetical protein
MKTAAAKTKPAEQRNANNQTAERNPGQDTAENNAKKEPAKRGRKAGRPKVAAAKNAPAKRGRKPGRPKGSPNKKAADRIEMKEPGKRGRKPSQLKAKDDVHIGRLIHERLKDTRMKQANFAKLMNISPQSAYNLFKRASCDTATLRKVSHVLKYDFFKYYINPELMSLAPKEVQEMAALREEVRELKEQKQYLIDLVKLQKEKLR